MLREDVRVSDAALGFARAMTDLHGTTFDLLYFLEKPWKWQHEYDAWRSHGSPLGQDAATWDRWAIAELAR